MPAERYTYDADGRLSRTEHGTVPGVAPSDWAAFSSLRKTEVVYDASGREIQATDSGWSMSSSSWTITGVRNFSYWPDGRAKCTAVRMDPTTWSTTAPPLDACTLSTGSQAYGPDRITETVYDADGHVLQVIRALGLNTGPNPLQQAYSTSTYTANGQLATLQDANTNLTSYAYDGFGRLQQVNFPSPSRPSPPASNPSDMEIYGYDANGSRTSLTRRDGKVINYQYDALNREIYKSVPSPTSGGAATVTTTTYDLASRKLAAQYASGQGVQYAWDNAGRLQSETTSGVTPSGQAFSNAMSFGYDAAGNRTTVTWPDQFYATYVYDPLSRVTAICENVASAATCQAATTISQGLLASYTYNPIGTRAQITRGNGTTTVYNSYDLADRLTELDHNFPTQTPLAGQTPPNPTLQQLFTYNPASQVITRSSSNALYAFTSQQATPGTTFNGLNQDATIAAVGTGGFSANGNLINDGARTFTYDEENHLLSGTSATTSLALGYDPLGRLEQQVSTVGGGTPTPEVFVYDGDRLSAEASPTGGALLRRYVHGTGVDEPIVWYEYQASSQTFDRRWLHADRQGSIIAQSNVQWNSSGVMTATVTQTYAYGAYGEPQNTSWGASRFLYTGQIELPELKLYHYKARVYDPIAGRFLQTDPVGYKDDNDLYAYVGDDPINKADPTGEFGNIFRNDDLGCSRMICEANNHHPNLGDPAAHKKPSGRGSNGNRGRHHYDLDLPLCNDCTEDEAFEAMRNFSAPGAPYAEAGTYHVTLTGNNPITQLVDVNHRTITNTTEPSHVFYPGTVVIQIHRVNGVVSAHIVGDGNGGERWQNQYGGQAIFIGLAGAAFLSLNPHIADLP